MHKLIELENYAVENKIPIIEKEGLEIIIKLIKEHHINTILEIGTAIGYSAINFSLKEKCYVDTIERNIDLYNIAKTNVNKFNLDNRINVILGDALKINIDNDKKYDCIYIDGAKAQYYNFFNHYIDNLKKDGIMIFDNLNFHGLVFSDAVSNHSRNIRALVRKLENFINQIKQLDNYEFKIIPEGDGIGILKRKV